MYNMMCMMPIAYKNQMCMMSIAYKNQKCIQAMNVVKSYFKSSVENKHKNIDIVWHI